MITNIFYHSLKSRNEISRERERITNLVQISADFNTAAYISHLSSRSGSMYKID